MAPRETDKKASLTLEKLVSYDDVITDALVDKIYFWATIRKNRGGRFSAARGLREEDITNILRERVIIGKDVGEAMQELVKLPTFRKFMHNLNDKEREHFTRHLRRYASIYMPDCPFEVTTTNRYTITDHEASVTARRDINPREEIKYLTGVQVAMTEEQEKTLELARKDFSLVISSRRKTRSLFLGPARFANHDCDANARLSTKGYDGMQIVAVKPIAQGEEITVSYGEDYFGDDNEECLCQTCEDKQVNGWAPFKREEDSEDEDNEEALEEGMEDQNGSFAALQEGSYSFRNKRRYQVSAQDSSRDSTPAKRRRVSKSTPTTPCKQTTSAKLPAIDSPTAPELIVSSVEDVATVFSHSKQSPRDIRNQQRIGLFTLLPNEATSSRNTTPQSVRATSSPKSSHSTDATSVDEEQASSTAQGTLIKVEPDTIDTIPALGVATLKDEVTIIPLPLPTPTPFNDDIDETSSELSELSESYEFDDDLQVLKRKSKRLRPPPLLSRNARSASRNSAHPPAPSISIEPPTLSPGWIPNPRRTGDYATSAALLATKDNRWASCQTCEDDFVQHDANHGTRKECPRCERHSKLYGFKWPKTERDGKWDREERVLDHRTIHRFVDAEEEKELRRERPRRRRGRPSRGEVGSTRETSMRSSVSFEVEEMREKTGITR